MHRFLMSAVAGLIFLGSTPAHAWWDFGHRLTGEIAWAQLSDSARQQLYDILQAHPRYQEDFTAAMPEEIRLGSLSQRQSWLLGRAAYWPDVARDLPDEERRRYNRSNWHYIDGALIRDRALRQGNTYIDISPFPDGMALPAAQLESEAQVNNILLALDYNARVFTDADSSPADRAVALCWILHLGGDIHQPLHTGTAFSRLALQDGDAGGNGVPTDGDLNLHARWDGALSNRDFAATRNGLLAGIEDDPLPADAVDDWSQWMAESRDILLGGAVYDEAVVAAIRRADASGTVIQPVTLDPDYIVAMEDIAAVRLSLAGVRLARWLEHALQ
ncbi:MAG: hypothetical protein RLZZ385_530 [Pseudomonadota bacterium]|jgi:hypothetical protein